MTRATVFFLGFALCPFSYAQNVGRTKDSFGSQSSNDPTGTNTFKPVTSETGGSKYGRGPEPPVRDPIQNVLSPTPPGIDVPSRDPIGTGPSVGQWPLGIPFSNPVIQRLPVEPTAELDEWLGKQYGKSGNNPNPQSSAPSLVPNANQRDGECVAAIRRLKNAVQLPSAEVAQIQGDYDAKCLAGGIDLPDPLRNDLGWLVGVLAVYDQKSSATAMARRVCTATRVGRDLILTARHCVDYNGRGEVSPEFLASARFLHPASRVGPTRIRAVIENDYFRKRTNRQRSDTPDSRDYVLLRIDPLDIPLPPLKTAPLKGGEELIVYSFNSNAASANWFNGKTCSSYDPSIKALHAVDHHDPTCSLRWDKLTPCAVLDSSSRCIVHGCQTDAGSSGAALFLRDASGPVFVGLHISSSLTVGAAPGSCPKPGDILSDANKAIIPDDKFWKAIARLASHNGKEAQ